MEGYNDNILSDSDHVFNRLRALGYGEGVNFKGELGRWVSFFWHGAYHRNMIWLVR